MDHFLKHNMIQKKNFEKKIVDIDEKIPNTNEIVKKTDLNKKITEIQNKIPSITGLVNSAALNTNASDIEIKILDSLSTKSTEAENLGLMQVVLLQRLNLID